MKKKKLKDNIYYTMYICKKKDRRLIPGLIRWRAASRCGKILKNCSYGIDYWLPICYYIITERERR